MNPPLPSSLLLALWQPLLAVLYHRDSIPTAISTLFQAPHLKGVFQQYLEAEKSPVMHHKLPSKGWTQAAGYVQTVSVTQTVLFPAPDLLLSVSSTKAAERG